MKRSTKHIVGIVSLFLFLTTFICPATILARAENPLRPVSRGEATDRILDAFDLKYKKRSFLSACREQPAECFFVFSAMSDFDDIAFEPFLRLYPDVNEKYRYYSAVTTASMLGLIHGYLNEEKTPFKPEIVMTRVQALKVILGAADLLRWKDRFELSADELENNAGYTDEALANSENWWYSRYMSFAAEHGIVPEKDLFRPDDPVTIAELTQMLDGTRIYLEERINDSKTLALGN